MLFYKANEPLGNHIKKIIISRKSQPPVASCQPPVASRQPPVEIRSSLHLVQLASSQSPVASPLHHNHLILNCIHNQSSGVFTIGFIEDIGPVFFDSPFADKQLVPNFLI